MGRKKEWLDQSALTFCDPSRHVLDSIFRAMLKERGIKAEIAIRCIGTGKVIDTSADSSLYKEVNLLESIVNKIDYNKENNITLQAYATISSWTKLNRMKWSLVLFLLFLILAMSILGYFQKLFKKALLTSKEQAMLIKQKESELLKLQNDIISFNTTKKVAWKSLPCDLSFNEKHGELRYKEQQPVCLTGNSLKLFRCFIKTEDYRVTYEDICTDALRRCIKNVVEKSDRESASTAIRRLKDQLEPFPSIEIISIKSIGYQMVFFRLSK